MLGVRWQASWKQQGRQQGGRPYTHTRIRRDNSLWIHSGFTPLGTALEMNFNTSATLLQIRAQLPR